MDAKQSTPAEVSLPLVILPGLICDSRMFGTQVRDLGAIVVDGFYGQADRIAAMADYALERMPARCAVLGHSMGARVALEIWARAPRRVARLALADTGIHTLRAGEREARYRLRDLGRREGSEALIDQWLPPMVGEAHRGDIGLMRELRAMAVDGGIAGYERQIEALLHRPDAGELLPTINCPTLVIVGADDRWSPVSQHEEIASRIPGAELRIVENAGHMAPAEEPGRFNAFVREWLSAKKNGSGQRS